MIRRPLTRDDDDNNDDDDDDDDNDNYHSHHHNHNYNHHHLEMRQGSRSVTNMPIPCYIEDFVNREEVVVTLDNSDRNREFRFSSFT